MLDTQFYTIYDSHVGQICRLESILKEYTFLRTGRIIHIPDCELGRQIAGCLLFHGIPVDIRFFKDVAFTSPGDSFFQIDGMKNSWNKNELVLLYG